MRILFHLDCWTICQKYCHSKNHKICTYFSVDLAVQAYPPWKKEKKEAWTKLIPYLPILHPVIHMWKVWANSVMYTVAPIAWFSHGWPLNGFITMCNLKKRFIRVALWVLLKYWVSAYWTTESKRHKDWNCMSSNRRGVLRSGGGGAVTSQ